MAPRRSLASALAVSILLLVPATGHADKRFRGTTSQGRAVRLAVGDDGAVKRIIISWRARCDNGRFREETIFRPGRRATPDGVRSRGRYVVRQKGGYRATITTRLTARRSFDAARPEAERWAGMLRATVVVRRRGRTVDRCRSPRLRWAAALPGAATPPPTAPVTGAARVRMSGDPGDYITGGRSYAFDHPSATITAGGARRQVSISVDAPDGSIWRADFAPAPGDALVAGRRYEGATRYPFNGANPGLDVGGDGRGCNGLTGHFTVTEAKFDARGLVTAFAASFEQRCHGAAAAARGTFEWRAAGR